jgi:hypothetical protein
MEIQSLQEERSTSLSQRHFYQFYKGREDFLRAVIPFLWVGLKNKEACLWIVSKSVGIVEAIEGFHRHCDLTPFIESRQLLILPAERWYLERGRFSESRVLQKFTRFVAERKRLGFQKCRIVGDVGWFEQEDWPKFQSYEAKAHAWLRTSSGTALCAYPIWRCTPTQIKDILDCHDSVFLTKL